MDRGNHYEAAFEGYLRARRLGYVAIDETHRASLDDEPVKSLDFVVYGASGSRLLIDVKGRRFPGGPKDRPRRVWESWCGREDVDGLERWAERFGDDYVPLLVFAYHIRPMVKLPLGVRDLWFWRGKAYLYRAVHVDEYRRHMRTRSPKWETVMLSTADFRRLVRPLSDFTHVAATTAALAPALA